MAGLSSPRYARDADRVSKQKCRKSFATESGAVNELGDFAVIKAFINFHRSPSVGAGKTLMSHGARESLSVK
jgi:hypothetical protein